MQRCIYCGNEVPPGAILCQVCGRPAGPPDKAPDQVYSSVPQGWPAASPRSTSSVPPGPASGVGRPADPEAGLHTVLAPAKDRQAEIATRLVESSSKPPSPEPAANRGLAESRVGRDIEDAFDDVKTLLRRFGRVGRMTFYSQLLVAVGTLSPWYYVPHQGLTPGVERWGWMPLGLAVLSIATLVWRHRPSGRARVLPVLLNLALAAAGAVSLVWIYQDSALTPIHLRPHLVPSFYVTCLGALLALLGSVLHLKNVR